MGKTNRFDFVHPNRRGVLNVVGSGSSKYGRLAVEDGFSIWRDVCRSRTTIVMPEMNGDVVRGEQATGRKSNLENETSASAMKDIEYRLGSAMISRNVMPR